MMAKISLFCFTYAGGNASFFDMLDKELKGIEIHKLEYAGHGTRHKEPFYSSFEKLADDAYRFIKSRHNGGEYALFGYSMGTIVLAEVMRKVLACQEIAPPCCVFLAAHEPHSKPELEGFSDESLDEWIREQTVKFGGIPDKLTHNKSFWRMYLPIYRADYSLLAKYRFEDLDFKTGIPATIFYSETDTPRTEMELWRKFFTGKCEFFRFEGNHFFISQYYQEMARIIKERILGKGG